MAIDEAVTKNEEAVEEDKETMEKVTKFVDGLAADVRRRVFSLYSIQKEYTSQHEQYLQELRELEQKHEQLFLPFYEKRRDIVEGSVEPTPEEISAGSKIMEISEEKETEKAEEKKDEGKVGIPNFWLTIFKNNETLQEAVTQRDEDCLRCLVDVSSKNFEDPNKGFTLTFKFKENPYFSNTTLTKKYFLDDDDDILLEKAEGCKIEWMTDKNLTVEAKKKKQKHKGSKNVRTVTVMEPCDSFFNFFTPPVIPEDEDDEKDDEEIEELEDRLENDYEIGRTIKDKLIPKAVDWYTGEAVPPLQFPMDEDEGEGAEDDDDEAPAARKHIKDTKKSKPSQTSEEQQKQQEECKQQ